MSLIVINEVSNIPNALVRSQLLKIDLPQYEIKGLGLFKSVFEP